MILIWLSMIIDPFWIAMIWLVDHNDDQPIKSRQMIMITVRGHSAHNIGHPDGCTLRKGFYDGCHVARNYDFLVAIGAVIMISMIFDKIIPQIMDYWIFRTNPVVFEFVHVYSVFFLLL